ncbi:hypothetical protein DSO57_1035551, partial [Entomophthora muscae]
GFKQPTIPDNISFPKVLTCNTGSLGDEISNPANEKSPKPAPSLKPDTCPSKLSNIIATNDNHPASDISYFYEVPTLDTGCLLGEICKSTYESCPKLAQSPESGIEAKYLSNANTQVAKQEDLKSYYPEVTNDNTTELDVILPALES